MLVGRCTSTGACGAVEWGLTAVGNHHAILLRCEAGTLTGSGDTCCALNMGYNTHRSEAESIPGVTERLDVVFRGKTDTVRKRLKITPSRALYTEYRVSRGHRRDPLHPRVGTSSPRRLEPVWESMSKIWGTEGVVFGVHPKSWLPAPDNGVPARERRHRGHPAPHPSVL